MLSFQERYYDAGKTDGFEEAIKAAIRKNAPQDLIEAMAEEANIPPQRLSELRELATA